MTERAMANTAEAMADGMAGPRPGKAVGEDLRRRAVAAVLERGMSFEAAARKFEVETTSVFRWVRRFREQGNFRPGRPRGRPSRIESERARILRILKERPDISGRALQSALAAEGAVFSAAAVQRFLARHGLDRKTRLARRRGRADGA